MSMLIFGSIRGITCLALCAAISSATPTFAGDSTSGVGGGSDDAMTDRILESDGLDFLDRLNATSPNDACYGWHSGEPNPAASGCPTGMTNSSPWNRFMLHSDASVLRARVAPKEIKVTALFEKPTAQDIGTKQQLNSTKVAK